MLLNEKIIKNATPRAKPFKLADGDGLYLLVQPGGTKLWRLKYRYLGKENTLSIGKYPEVLLTEARDHRYEARKLLRQNIDPNGQKRDFKKSSLFGAGNVFKAVAEDWHNLNSKKWSADHAQRVWRRLELYAFSSLGSKPVTAIKTPELVAILRKVEKRKAETARRLVQTIHAVFRHAVHCGLIEHNPAANLGGIIAPHQVNHFAAINPSGITELLAKLEIAKTTPQNKLAVKLLMNVFLRPGELRYGEWSEIDWVQKIWIIPPERMKKRRPHVVPLSDSSLELLGQLKVISGYSKYLFPSQSRRKHAVMSENTINKVLKTMGYKGKQVGHGFRAVASTVLNESGLFRSDVIEFQLAHVEESSSRKPYNRAEYLEERRTMMQWYSEYLAVSTLPLTT